VIVRQYPSLLLLLIGVHIALVGSVRYCLSYLRLIVLTVNVRTMPLPKWTRSRAKM
jgi:hypothetical protein